MFFFLNEAQRNCLPLSYTAFLLICFSCIAYAECKLSRPGPPATIVTIDEESPNGMYESENHISCLFMSALLYSVVFQMLLYSSDKGCKVGIISVLQSVLFANATRIDTFPAGIVHWLCHNREGTQLVALCSPWL